MRIRILKEDRVFLDMDVCTFVALTVGASGFTLLMPYDVEITFDNGEKQIDRVEELKEPEI